MKISELIAELYMEMREHGDVDVVIETDIYDPDIGIRVETLNPKSSVFGKLVIW